MRIVSLLPSATEIVAALGLRERLVGRSHECDYPEGVDQVPALTSSILDAGLTPQQIDAAVREAALEGTPLYMVDAKRLAALEPDVILTQGVCSVCAVSEPTVADTLKLLPVELATAAKVVSLEGKDFAGVMADIQAVGDAVAQSDRATTLVHELERRWDAVTPADGKRVVILEWPDPPWIAGHWVPEQVARAGGQDLFGEPGALSVRTTWEAVAEADPDVIVVAACGFDLQRNSEEARALFTRPETASIGAVQRGEVYAVDANSFFSRPAPRVVDGVELLAKVLRGDVSGDDAAGGRVAQITPP